MLCSPPERPGAQEGKRDMQGAEGEGKSYVVDEQEKHLQVVGVW